MTVRIAWLSPFSPASGVGTFSKAVTDRLPATLGGEPVDLTIMHPINERLYTSPHRLIPLDDVDFAARMLPLFDRLVFNIGNNCEHHGLILDLLRRFPGVVICHDYVYQHVLADLSQRVSGGFSPFAALMAIYGGEAAEAGNRRARITSRGARPRYAPWEAADCVAQPLNEPFTDLAAALVVHSRFARDQVERSFAGPILQLGMPCDQKAVAPVRIAEATSEDGPLTLVSFGYIQATKCIELVIDALAQADLRRSVHYVVAGFAGDPNYLASLRQRVSDLGLCDVVTFETDVPEARLAELSACADLFVNLRRPNTEGGSASLVEQLQAGKAVLVLDSGCYGELPPEAAIKLPAGATSLDIAAALTRVIGNRAQLGDVGRAGRAWALRWTCRSYGEALFAFLEDQHGELDRRGAIVAVPRAIEPVLACEGAGEVAAWIERLARARRVLHLFAANLLSVDPELILGKQIASLALHVAEVVLGQVGRPRLVAALEAHLSNTDAEARYWACMQLHLLMAATRTADHAVVTRVRALTRHFEPAFWEVLEQMPTSQFVSAAQVLLFRDGEVVAAEDTSDEDDGFPNRLLLRDLLSPAQLSALPDALRHWINAPAMPATTLALPTTLVGSDWTAGSPAFRAATDLSGFHRQEPDHVWARGTRGFVGVKLAPTATRVEIYARQLHASATTPRVLRISCGGLQVSQRVTSPNPIWLGLDLPPHNGDDLTWIEVATDYAARPPDSADRRALGVALLRLRVATGPAVARIPPHLVPHAAA